MTSNLGAAETTALTSPRCGFGAAEQAAHYQTGANEDLEEKIARAGLAMVRRRFTPEFINRLDKIVTFKPLRSGQLSQILDIELKMVQQRIFDVSPDAFLFELTGAAKTLLLKEGTDARYGARHLKRAVERLLVQPICSLIATHQVRGGDCILVDWDRTIDCLMFIKQASSIPCEAMIEPTSRSSAARTNVTAKGAISDPAKAPARLSRVS